MSSLPIEVKKKYYFRDSESDSARFVLPFGLSLFSLVSIFNLMFFIRFLIKCSRCLWSKIVMAIHLYSIP